MLRKRSILLATVVSLMFATTSCDRVDNPITEKSSPQVTTEFHVNTMTANDELIITSSAKDMELFKEEFSRYAEEANSDVKMIVKKIDIEKYSVSFTGDLKDIVENDIIPTDEVECRGRKYYHFTVSPTLSGDLCFETYKRTRFGAAIWYAHVMPTVALNISTFGVVSSLQKGRCK